MIKTFWCAAAVVMASAMIQPAFAEPRACTCKDLPAMVKEIIEQEYLRDLFNKWSGYAPREVLSVSDMQAAASKEFNAHFYPTPQNGSSAAGSTDGGHASLGTLYESEDCGIGEYQYNNKGRPINKAGQEIVLDLEANKGSDGKPKVKVPKDNEQHLKPIKEKEYMNQPTSSCEALVKYPWIHEQVHQKTCQDLRAQGRTQMWKSLNFFAGNDAAAYKAGADALRQATKALAKDCGWDGSTGENAVPTPKDAKELAKKASRNSRNHAQKAQKGKKKTESGSDTALAIITGVAIDNSSVDVLLKRWDAECVDDQAEGCAALAASVETSLIDLLRSMSRKGLIERETLFDAAHAQSLQLKRLAMNLLGQAQTPEETEFALLAAEHASPAVREAARQMLRDSEDPRWKAMTRWWKNADANSLVPNLTPRPEYFGVESLSGLRHLPYATEETKTVFTTPEALDKVVARLAKGKTIMSNSSDLEKNAKSFEKEAMKLQQEMMSAAQSGDIQKMNKLTERLMAMQQGMMPADPMAVNTEKDSTGILLEKDAKTGLPSKVAMVRRDEASGQTVVTFQVLPQQ